MTRIKNAVKKAKEYDQPALAITDYGNLFGAVDFCQACDAEGIKPIVGTEVFIPNYDDHTLRQYKRGQDVYFQLVLLAKNLKGYQNICQLLTKAYLEGFYYKPRIDSKLLKEFKGELICLSAGFNGELNYHLMNDNYEAAKEAAKRLADIFPGDFYIELQDNGLGGQAQINEQLAQIASELSLPVVATNNVHYLKPDDAEAFEVLRGIQMGRSATSPFDNMKFSTDEYYMRSTEEMQDIFSKWPESLENTQKIVDQCDYNFQYGTYHLPKFETPGGMSLDEYLRDVAFQGLEERWPKIQKVSLAKDEDLQQYKNRLEHELKVICGMGFPGYFLIVSDFIRWAKDNQIPVGPGRGSGAGSLVAYCLKITDLDPLPYNLLFERFLNPERVSMPDFDIDFCQDKRGDVIQYVNEKYGNVCQIITFGKMKAKAVIRDVGRVMGLEYSEVDQIAKLIPNDLGITLQKALEQEPDLKKLYDKDETIHKLIDTSLKLEGLSRHASVHAAGVIITDKELWNFAPLYKGSKDDVVVQYEMKSAEKIGLIKFDFLGLKTLTVIDKAVKNVLKTQSKQLDMSQVGMDDEAVYESLSSGDGTGVFQLESSGMKDLMKRLKPGCFEDIVALVALYRPGPLGSGMVDDFIERKKGTKDITYDFDQLQPILKDTYGVIVYQEQVMQIASVLANYSLGEADLLRRAMGKKKAEEMAKQRERFLQGAKDNKIDLEKAGQVFDLMAKFAEYGFNKSHSAAYALVSYHTAWLKTHYVTEYMAALMSTEMEDTDKLLIFMQDSKAHGISFLPPDVNVSQLEFSVENDKVIRYSLGALKGVGTAAIQSIIEAREKEGPFQSLYDFCSRVDLRRVTKKVVEVLIKSGAFDYLKISKKGMVEAIPAIVDAAVTKQKNEQMGQSDLFGAFDSEATSPIGVEIKTDDDWSKNEILDFEKSVFGFYFSGHPLEVYADSLHKLTTQTVLTLEQVRADETAILGGIVNSHRTIFTKKGDKMAFAELEDLAGSVELIVFSRTFKECGDLLTAGEPLIVKGKVDKTENGVKILVEHMESLTAKLRNTTRSIHLTIPVQDFNSSQLDRAIALIKEYQGESSVYFHLQNQNEYNAVIELPRDLKAMACEPLMHRMNQLFKCKVVSFE